MARMKKGEITFYNLDGEEIEKECVEIKWDAQAAEKAGYEHFMMKEIHEQPRAVADTLHSVKKDDVLDLSSVGLSDKEIREISQIYIVACGSAYHVGVRHSMCWKIWRRFRYAWNWLRNSAIVIHFWIPRVWW